MLLPGTRLSMMHASTPPTNMEFDSRTVKVWSTLELPENQMHTTQVSQYSAQNGFTDHVGTNTDRRSKF